LREQSEKMSNMSHVAARLWGLEILSEGRWEKGDIPKI